MKRLTIQEQEDASRQRFDPQTGRPLTPEELSALPSYPYRQELLWIPHGCFLLDGIRSRPQVDPVPISSKPNRVWTLFLSRFQDRPPPLPILPIHNTNAFWEDVVHDWSVRGGKFHYCSRFIHDGGVWVLLEYEKENA